MSTEPQLPEGSVEVARITIVKVFTDDSPGGTAVYALYSDHLGLLDAMGMLAFVTATAPHDYRAFEDDPDVS